MKKTFSIVLPIYNNEKNLPITIEYIMEKMYLFDNYNVEIVMVNDGSSDQSYEVMKEMQAKYPNMITIANLENNFGQSACVAAACTLTEGDVVGVISADLQDPFELFHEMLEYWEKGNSFVYGVRTARQDKIGFVTICSKLIHKFMRRFVYKEWPLGGCDFFIIDRHLLDEYLAVKKNTCITDLVFRLSMTKYKVSIPYVRMRRQVGKSGYSIKSKMITSIRWILGNSYLPLKLIAILSLIEFIAGIVVLFIKNIPPNVVLAFVFIIGAGIMISISIMGIYLWWIFVMNKKLPFYIFHEIREKVN